jgi:hypothetical protein
MTTTTKAKNGKIGPETMAEAASKISEESKRFSEAWLEAGSKIAAESGAIWESQQKMAQENLATWRKVNQNYLDFVAETSQQWLEEGLAWRERLAKITENNLSKSQELWVAEQKMAMAATTAYWDQAQTTSKKMLELFAPAWLK